MRFLHYLGLILLILLIYEAGPRNLWAISRRAHWGWLLLAWALNLPQLGLKAYRWYLNVNWQQIKLSYPRAFLAYFSSLLVGFLTPGRVGEMAKVFTLKYECGVPLARGMSSVVLDRVFDLYLLLALGALGFMRYSILGTLLSWRALALLALLFLIPLFFLHAPTVRRLGGWAARLPLFDKRAAQIEEKAGQFADGLAVFNTPRVLICVLLTVASYFIYFVQCLMCARALNFTTPYFDMVFLMAATNLMTFIPISISGLGTRELCLTYFLGQIFTAMPKAEVQSLAVAFGLTIFAVFFVGGGLIGYVCWHWAPIGLRTAVRDVRNR